jgi:hypothetical protein
MDTSPQSLAWTVDAVLSAANRHPNRKIFFNISFLHFLGDTVARKMLNARIHQSFMNNL